MIPEDLAKKIVDAYFNFYGGSAGWRSTTQAAIYLDLLEQLLIPKIDEFFNLVKISQDQRSPMRKRPRRELHMGNHR